MKTEKYSCPYQFQANSGTKPRQWWPISHPKAVVPYQYYGWPSSMSTIYTECCEYHSSR
jgi:hypothetical protein